MAHDNVRRGLRASILSKILQMGELAFSTDKKGLHVGNGVTAGGALIIEADNWVPTFAVTTGSGTIALDAARYSRVGNVINFTLRCSWSGGAAGGVDATFTLPVASAFTLASDLVGVIWNSRTVQTSGQTVIGITPSGIGKFFTSLDGALSHTIFIVGQYEVK